MRFLIVSITPPRQGVLGVLPEKIEINWIETDETLDLNTITVPTFGECLVIPEESITKIKSRVVNEVVNDRQS